MMHAYMTPKYKDGQYTMNSEPHQPHVLISADGHKKKH